MVMYLTYTEYTNYGGTLDETIFNNLCFEAQSYIDWTTFNRLKNETTIPEEVKKCMYAIIDLVNKQIATLESSTEDGNVTAISNDGVSVTYNNMSASQLYEKLKTDIYNTISRHLYGVKNSKGKVLTYRGRYNDDE